MKLSFEGRSQKHFRLAWFIKSLNLWVTFE